MEAGFHYLRAIPDEPGRALLCDKFITRDLNNVRHRSAPLPASPRAIVAFLCDKFITQRPSMGKGQPCSSWKGSIALVLLGFALGTSFMNILHLQRQVTQQFQPEETSHKASGPTSHNPRPHYLEKLMYKYRSDKSHDDHGYTDIYQMLFDPIRYEVRQFVEIGVMAGQSIQAFFHYFPNATIHAFDLQTLPSTAAIVEQLQSRVRYNQADLLRATNLELEDFGLYPDSIDILIEDASHAFGQQVALLKKCFPLVKPGGYYIIEDVYLLASHEGHKWRDIDLLDPEVREILRSQDAVLVDAHVGHRNWAEWVKISGEAAKDHLEHNSYVLIIHKRSSPLPDVQTNYGASASDRILVTDKKETRMRF